MLNGVMLRLASVGCFASMSATVHQLSATVPTGQIIFWRSAVALIPVLIYMLIQGKFPAALRTSRPWGHLVRGLFGCASMTMSFLSLAYLPVANATALAFLGPLISLPVAGVMLKEQITRRIAMAALIGFGGVLAMLAGTLVHPSGDPKQLIGIAAGLGFAATMGFVRVQIRDLTRTESAATISLYFSVTCTIFGAASIYLGWVPLTNSTLGILIFAGLLGGVGQILATEAAARVPVSQLAPFDYTGMIWALGFDVILFGLLPDWMSLVGMALIVGAGIVSITTPKAQKPTAAPPAPRQPWH
ncbi:DMT family transporter [Pseudoprimorskyibacter insulae]|uniref:Riboflavin transporter n=1 Tax=Pseudoprimorskyibacter insulae TaxID=1695997 RepID=A0A2R8AUY0_9RHOB|nr:DMT family transporter [Pseudoprimorskyibacter insulae]SPF79833.1 Riboflavin transporter [Pseudoprimorskyibacter insulae]